MYVQVNPFIPETMGHDLSRLLGGWGGGGGGVLISRGFITIQWDILMCP